MTPLLLMTFDKLKIKEQNKIYMSAGKATDTIMVGVDIPISSYINGRTGNKYANSKQDIISANIPKMNRLFVKKSFIYISF